MAILMARDAKKRSSAVPGGKACVRRGAGLGPSRFEKKAHPFPPPRAQLCQGSHGGRAGRPDRAPSSKPGLTPELDSWGRSSDWAFPNGPQVIVQELSREIEAGTCAHARTPHPTSYAHARTRVLLCSLLPPCPPPIKLLPNTDAVSGCVPAPSLPAGSGGVSGRCFGGGAAPERSLNPSECEGSSMGWDAARSPWRFSWDQLQFCAH